MNTARHGRSDCANGILWLLRLDGNVATDYVNIYARRQSGVRRGGGTGTTWLDGPGGPLKAESPWNARSWKAPVTDP